CAIDDDGHILSKLLRGLGCHRFQGNVDRPRQVLLLIFRGWKDFNKLDAVLRHQCFHVFTTNFDRHRENSSKFLDVQVWWQDGTIRALRVSPPFNKEGKSGIYGSQDWFSTC